MGLRPVDRARCCLDGRDISHATTRDRLRAGIGYVPEDRQEDGLVGDFSVADNLILDVYDRPPYASGIALNLDAIQEIGRQPGRRSTTCGPRRCETPAGHAVRRQPAEGRSWPARWAGTSSCCWPASRPAAWTSARSSSCTSGSSPSGTRAWPCCIVSSELDEIYALADRIAVMYEGQIVGFWPPTVPVEELGLLMAGAGARSEARAATAAPRPTSGPAQDERGPGRLRPPTRGQRREPGDESAGSHHERGASRPAAADRPGGGASDRPRSARPWTSPGQPGRRGRQARRATPGSRSGGPSWSSRSSRATRSSSRSWPSSWPSWSAAC